MKESTYIYKTRVELVDKVTGDIWPIGTKCRVSKNGNIVHGSRLLFSKKAIEKNPLLYSKWFEKIPKEPKTVDDIETGHKYYYNGLSTVLTYEDTWTGCEVDRARRTLGNVFLTRDEGQNELEWLKAREILKRDTKGFKPDASDPFQSRYYVCYDIEDNELFAESALIGIEHPLYFATREEAEESIHNHGKEWKIYLGVEKDEN